MKGRAGREKGGMPQQYDYGQDLVSPAKGSTAKPGGVSIRFVKKMDNPLAEGTRLLGKSLRQPAEERILNK